jgi:cytidylate kinase
LPVSDLVIAIDGPAGAGKSTVAKRLAKSLGLRYLDTGAMYRALALKAQRAGLGPDDGIEAGKLGESTSIEFGTGDPQLVLLDGENVTDLIRTLEIGELASALSAHTPVRRVLAKAQQELVREGGFTLEGRDVTTVIAPNAQVKVFLTASLEERARRRHEELLGKGQQSDLAAVTAMIAERDHRDSTRADSPLSIAPGSVVIDSSDLTVDEVVEQIETLARPFLSNHN